MAKTKKPKKLKASEFLRQVDGEIKTLMRDPDVSFDMAVWYYSRPFTNECTVCAGGAHLLAQIRAGKVADPERGLYAWNDLKGLPTEVADRMRALNYIRLGTISAGLEILGVPKPKGERLYPIFAAPPTLNSARGTCKRLREVADRIEIHGY